MKFKVTISSEMAADVTVIRDGDMLTATVGRNASLSVSAGIAPEKLMACRDAARADLSSVETDECDGHRTHVRSTASKVVEAQCVGLLRFLGVTADTPDAYAIACATDYAERVASEGARPAPRAEAQAILAALPTASRDETFALLAKAKKVYDAPWVNPIWAAERAALIAANAAAEKARIEALPDDTSWGYAHGGTD